MPCRKTAVAPLLPVALCQTGAGEAVSTEACVSSAIPLDVLTHLPSSIGVVHPIPSDATRRVSSTPQRGSILTALPLTSPFLESPVRRT